MTAFKLFLFVFLREGWRHKPPPMIERENKMYMSKVQVKNVVAKNFGKYSISRLMKGRVVYFSSHGYKFAEKENGFIRVFYSAPIGEVSNASFEAKDKLVHSLLINNGFEFDGIDGFRKERKNK